MLLICKKQKKECAFGYSSEESCHCCCCWRSMWCDTGFEIFRLPVSHLAPESRWDGDLCPSSTVDGRWPSIKLYTGLINLQWKTLTFPKKTTRVVSSVCVLSLASAMINFVSVVDLLGFDSIVCSWSAQGYMLRSSKVRTFCLSVVNSSRMNGYSFGSQVISIDKCLSCHTIFFSDSFIVGL